MAAFFGLEAKSERPKGKGNRMQTPAGKAISGGKSSSITIWQETAGKFTPAAIAKAEVPQSLPLTSMK
jgi:hypothetical protein